MNPERGEVAVTLGGGEYTMRPSWEALLRIERRIAPKTMIQLMTEYSERAISAEEATIIVTEGIRAHAIESGNELLKGLSERRVGELIYEAGGVPSVLGAVLEFVMNINGGSTKKKDGEGLPTE